MKYTSNTAIGDAGEYFFAYQISHILGWPCRLFDIDIGIDAQVEILDEDRNSTGRFVAFQIKTSADEEPQPSWYVKKKQLDYWRDMDTPVFIVLISLSKQTMYLHHIRKKFAYHVTEKDSIRIDFDLAREQFNESSGRRIKAAAEESIMTAIQAHLSDVQMKIDEIKSAIEGMEDYSDPEHLIEIMNRRKKAYEDLLQAKTLSANYKVGATQCKDMEIGLEETLNELRTFMRDWNMHIDWDDRKYGNGEIQKFIDEA
ncbi:TPA: DUF4365 domain-containing protein [Pseudomonas aeruginosa]|uniref:DUF4365 domain-containing protein n=1 Tax=Pseudomonas TaxID=286 RepID=UPI000362B201|nr:MULTISPECIES: DUF4365 domain-containing protein [Pseudomonas]MDG0898865.1 DUF4365 domain-containing protein [Pseudomonas sp. L01]ALY65640.1 hypothetical protein HW05_12155 [Pseudomonas aeruginosa]ELS1858424.1 DUF4365 domain-containing protein [Pseudomonas aeruginosa]KSE34482.1 hypothetical protein AO916_07575 [Pseudomonas aeruginosa]KSJ65684.1 hypothetical protein APA21_15865 [Pseudomonas aeruginosa]